MNDLNHLQPIISFLEKNKKISNQQIMDLVKTDSSGLQNIRSILIDGKDILDDNLIGIRLRETEEVGFLAGLFGKKKEIISVIPQYDIFISYSRQDLTKVNEILKKLEQYRKNKALQPLRMFLDKTEIKVGDWESKILRSLKGAKVMLANVSPAYFKSEYCELEWHNFISFEVEKKSVRETIAWLYIDSTLEIEKQDNNNEWHRELKARQYLDLRQHKSIGIKQAKEIYDSITSLLNQVVLANQPVYSNIPPLSFRALMRNELYAKIDKSLWFTAKAQYPALVLTGKHGSGKTTLAYLYAKAKTNQYQGGIYEVKNANVITDLLDLIPLMLQTLGVEMTASDLKDRKWLRDKLNSQLRNKEQMLWILDDVPDIAWLKSAEHLRNLFPAEAKIHWLITTNELAGRAIKMKFMAEPIEDFKEDEALSYLALYQPIVDEPQKQKTQKLLLLIGLKPINVMLLGSLMYLNQIKQETQSIEQQLNQAPQFGDLLGAVVARLPAIEQRILQLSTLMPSDALMLDWLFEFNAWLNQSQRGIKHTTLGEWQLATDHLLGLGFLTHTDDERVKNINPILQKYLETQATRKLQETLYQFLSNKVNTNTDYKNLPVFAKYFISTIPNQSILSIDIIHDLTRKLDYYSFTNLALTLCNLLINHQNKLNQFNLAYTHYRKSYILANNGDYRLAGNEIERCIRLAINMQNEDLVGIGYYQKSRILKRLEDNKQALEFIDKAIVINENNPEKNTNSLANFYNQKSIILESLEDNNQALEFIDKAIEIHEKNNPDKNPISLANGYHQKSRILGSLERYDEALVFIDKDIAIEEKNNPDKNTNDLANSYHQKSRILERLEDNKQALYFIDESIAIKEKNNPEKNTISLANGYHQKSRILGSLERYDEALVFIDKAIAIEEKNNPEKNTNDLANSYHQKSRILKSLDRNKEALVFIDISIAIQEKKNPEKNTLSLAHSYALKATIVSELIQYQDALYNINLAIDIIQVKFPTSISQQNYQAIKSEILEKMQ